MFTDRFIKIPVDLYDTKNADLVGYSEETKTGNSVMSFLALEISHYRETHDDNDELSNTLIHMKNGDSFVCAITVSEFEKILNDKS